jgi:hypothetical protein
MNQHQTSSQAGLASLRGAVRITPGGTAVEEPVAELAARLVDQATDYSLDEADLVALTEEVLDNLARRYAEVDALRESATEVR